MHKNSIACTTRIDYLLGNSEEPTGMASSRAFRSGVNEDSIGFGDTGDLLGCNATESLASVPPLGATPPPSRFEVEALLVHFAREDSGWGHAMPICHACSIPSGPTGNHRSRRSGPGRVLQRGARSLPQRLLLTRNGVNAL